LNPLTELATFSIEETPALPPSLSHQHFRHLTDAQLAQLYSTAGLYLLASRHEGFGLTAAEAMACGSPVVATEADGNEEFCVNGETALTAPADDVETLARHCMRLQRDPELAASLAQAGRQRILHYTWDRVIDLLEAEFAQTPVPAVVAVAPEEITAACDPDTMFPVEAAEYPDLDLDDEPEADWTIVIPTVNSVDKVLRCVASCRRHAPLGHALQFVVVDDGSPDRQTIDRLRAASSTLDFELRCNHQNLGFSAAVNHGMRQAGGRFVLLCNSDIEFDGLWAEPLEQAFASDPYAGIAGLQLLYPDGRTIQFGGSVKSPGQLAYYHRHQRKPAGWPETLENSHTWYATGALMAIRRQALQKLGGLSNAYALSHEDLDYCLYSWTRGVRVLYCGKASARHQEGGSRGATREEKQQRPLFWMYRETAAHTYFVKKWSVLRYHDALAPFLRIAPWPAPSAEQLPLPCAK
jgi:GT2 family glycosyltransferase